jgi:hypothetical protein
MNKAVVSTERAFCALCVSRLRSEGEREKKRKEKKEVRRKSIWG